jgi:hypothetical protein
VGDGGGVGDGDEESEASVFEDFGGAGGAVGGDDGGSESEGFEEDVGHAFDEGGEDEGVCGGDPGGGVLLESGELDLRFESCAADLLLEESSVAAFSEECDAEFELGVLCGEELGGFDEEVETFFVVESSDGDDADE